MKGHNGYSIGVVLIGGHGAAATDQFSAHFTPAQDAALRDVIAGYRHSFGTLKLRGKQKKKPPRLGGNPEVVFNHQE